MMETELKELLQQIKEEKAQLIAERNKPSMFRNSWNWAKPYIIPFIFGVIVGGLVVSIPIPTMPFVSQQSAKLEQQAPVVATLEQQAALGGAAVPFPSVSPSPPPLNSPPSDWSMEEAMEENMEENREEMEQSEPIDSSLTTTSESPSPSSPQADSGETPSTRYYRLPLRRTR